MLCGLFCFDFFLNYSILIGRRQSYSNAKYHLTGLGRKSDLLYMVKSMIKHSMRGRNTLLFLLLNRKNNSWMDA